MEMFMVMDNIDLYVYTCSTCRMPGDGEHSWRLQGGRSLPDWNYRSAPASVSALASISAVSKLVFDWQVLREHNHASSDHWQQCKGWLCPWGPRLGWGAAGWWWWSWWWSWSYLIFVADKRIVRGATNFMWSNFAPHGNFWWSCRTKLLYMTSNLAPQDKIVCPVE